MKLRFSPPRPSGDHGSGRLRPVAVPVPRWRSLQGRRVQSWLEFSMKWETPVAIDFRFGMEITMYIANR